MIANCSYCGRVFMKVRDPICPACTKKVESTFQVVRTYLYEHRYARLIDVVEELGVDLKVVVKLIQEGRLYFVDNPHFGIECEGCGKPTSAGKYCPSCQEQLVRDLANASLCVSRVRQGPTGYFSKRD